MVFTTRRVQELQQALRLSSIAAGNRLTRARAIAPGTALAGAGYAMHAGQLSFVHPLVLLDRTAGLPDQLATLRSTRCLPRAPRQTRRP